MYIVINMRDFSKFWYSKSSFLRYLKCPLSFYFQYATPYGKIFSQSAEPEHITVGNTLHKFYCNFNRALETDEDEKVLCKKKVYEENINGLYKILLKYNLERAIESEVKYEDKELSLMGFIDAVYELTDETINTIVSENIANGTPIKKIPNGKLAIIDYKTGKYHDYLHRTYIKELNTYVLLYEAATGKRVDWIGMFYTHEPHNSFIEPVNRRKLGNDKKEFEKCKQNIIDCKFERKHSNLCYWCDFQNVCDDHADEIVDKAEERLFNL